jgi:hypothetical protein
MLLLTINYPHASRTNIFVFDPNDNSNIPLSVRTRLHGN